jgi:hypothetical protein
VVVYPAFWRTGVASLGSAGVTALGNLCRALDIGAPAWGAVKGPTGFSRLSVLRLAKSVTARGWLLWLSGIFDPAGVCLWDTLTDRWAAKPRYQLPGLRLDLEVVIAES